MQGFIYILSHKRMPGIVKIGHTTTSVGERIASMSSESGVPGKFDIIFSKKVDDSLVTEKIIHNKLMEFRLLPNKEFFEIKPSLAIKYVNKIIGNKLFDVSVSVDQVAQMNIVPTPKELGKTIRYYRKQMKIRQSDLAMVAGTGLRLIGDIERGKKTVQLGKVMDVLAVMGIKLLIDGRKTI